MDALTAPATCASIPVTERRFAAMGTDAHILVVGGGDGLATDAIRRIDELEARWSRFRSDSELCRLNASDGAGLEVSADTFLLVQRACQAWHLSGGSFDPTILPSLEAHGYDRSFPLLNPKNMRVRESGPAPGCADIELDDVRSTVRLPSGVRLDPGGIGKGLAADLVARGVMAHGALGVLVSIGGDMVALGTTPDGSGWTVSIDEPSVSSNRIATLAFEEGAVATSVTTRRVWRTATGETRHHLLDPSTGQPHVDGPILVTSLAWEGWRAEAATKAHLTGRPVAGALATVPTLLVDRDGQISFHGGMQDYLS